MKKAKVTSRVDICYFHQFRPVTVQSKRSYIFFGGEGGGLETHFRGGLNLTKNKRPLKVSTMTVSFSSTRPKCRTKNDMRTICIKKFANETYNDRSKRVSITVVTSAKQGYHTSMHGNSPGCKYTQDIQETSAHCLCHNIPCHKRLTIQHQSDARAPQTYLYSSFSPIAIWFGTGDRVASCFFLAASMIVIVSSYSGDLELIG